MRIAFLPPLPFTGETAVMRIFMDMRAFRIYDGPSEVHRMVIARNLLKAAGETGTTRAALGGLA